ncbi:uncharacterized LabA/DUF88 family protein [Paenibacillus mucilaginosus]|uniref:NYN domain-containing protein n=1 Tax=Paenibacillus mucilaginosus TaxID=61624 RepID=UPI003D1C9DAF
MKAAILVDENNALCMLHDLGVHAIRWYQFFRAIHAALENDFGQADVGYHFYGCLPPKFVSAENFTNRTKFFKSLQRDGIQVHKGFCYCDSNGVLTEKGIDVEISLDLFEFSLDDYDLLFVFSGDGDLAPAIRRAQQRTKVVAVVSRLQSAHQIKKWADGVLYLEDVIRLLDDQHVIRKQPQKPFEERAIYVRQQQESECIA